MSNNKLMFYNMMNYGFYGFGFISMLLFWVVVIVAIVVLVKWLGNGPAEKGGEDKAIKALRERYAKGEINKKEFEEKKKDLESFQLH